jgi:hypothetical protein
MLFSSLLPFLECSLMVSNYNSELSRATVTSESLQRMLAEAKSEIIQLKQVTNYAPHCCFCLW